MQYSIRHITHFTYGSPISQSIMEVRTCPRTDAQQQCYAFELNLTPHAQLFTYQDFMGNIVHHFNIPGRHTRLTLTAEALVDCAVSATLPERLNAGAWQQVDRQTASGEFWELLHDSPFARQTPLFAVFAQEVGLERADDPLGTLRRFSAERARPAQRPKVGEPRRRSTATSKISPARQRTSFPCAIGAFW